MYGYTHFQYTVTRTLNTRVYKCICNYTYLNVVSIKPRTYVCLDKYTWYTPNSNRNNLKLLKWQMLQWLRAGTRYDSNNYSSTTNVANQCFCTLHGFISVPRPVSAINSPAGNARQTRFEISFSGCHRRENIGLRETFANQSFSFPSSLLPSVRSKMSRRKPNNTH